MPHLKRLFGTLFSCVFVAASFLSVPRVQAAASDSQPQPSHKVVKKRIKKVKRKNAKPHKPAARKAQPLKEGK
jgi:hypothetical protein